MADESGWGMILAGSDARSDVLSLRVLMYQSIPRVPHRHHKPARRLPWGARRLR